MNPARLKHAVAGLNQCHAGKLEQVELLKVIPEVDDVVVENHVGVQEDASILLREHVGQEEPCCGADPEHVDHFLEVDRILDFNTGQRQLGLIVHLEMDKN